MKILIIASHPDDEVLGMGGTIAKHVASGHDVHVRIVCKRAYHHKFLPANVRKEKRAAQQAHGVLRYKSLGFFDLKDELLDAQLLNVIVPIEKAVHEVRPDVLYTHHRGDSNQDHRAVFSASMIASRAISSYKIPRVLCYEVPSSTDIAPPFPEYAFQPNFYVNVEPFLDRKLKAMRAYTRELKSFPHPRSLEGITVLAKKRGMESGFRAAEGFMVVREEWA